MDKALIERLAQGALNLAGNGMTRDEAFATLVAEECAKLVDLLVGAAARVPGASAEFVALSLAGAIRQKFGLG